MKQYKGPLSSTAKKLIEQSKDRLMRMQKTTGLGRISNSVYTIEESIEKYNPGITQDEIQAWVWYRRLTGTPMLNWKSYFVEPSQKQLKEWVAKGVLFYDATKKENNLVPYPIFVFGNLYEKVSKLKKHKETVIDLYGQNVFDNHIKIIQDLMPNKISISNPVESERPVILSISETARNFVVNSLKEIPLSEPSTLQEAYKDYLRTLSDDQFNKTRALEIINYYLNNENKPRSIEKEEWLDIKKRTRDEGERLFKKFLYEALEYNDQVRIDIEYNEKFNAIAPLQYHKIPIGLQISKKFMGNDLDIRLAQREGIAFMELVGSGIIAYDVGVGKTITAIIELSNAINSGKCKRPIVAVPNPTYKNWIKEILGNGDLQGILTGTGITINEWYNLGSDYDHIDVDNKVKEKTITLVTYEGLQKIGFNEYTANEHFEQLSDILSQRSEGTDRDKEKDNEKLREIIGTGTKETIADIETLGFDYIVVDEAHNFKNVFSEVKADEENGKQFHIKGGQPSNRGIKLFFIANYIQRKYGRNVMLLTATPFTNSPMEIYSMLSLVAFDYMKSWGITNLRTFFEQYISETTEHVVGIDGEIKQSNVVKSFNNRISLQKLINSHINFKTGEEANIPRPCKINLPRIKVATEKGIEKLKVEDQVLTYLKLTPEQQANQRAINSEASKGAEKSDPGKLLRLMSESLNNALSPFLYDKSQPDDYFDFVVSSPKIKYTMDCVASVKKYHEDRNENVSGQVIYIDRGKEYFHYIKEYLEKEVGYKKGVNLKEFPNQKVDEVEIISSGITQANKEKIKIAFNEGTCKIIIGTSTIKEGINLQEKSTVLYNLYPNWNPTDLRQLEGRIWRQKNMFGFVRIVMPLMENSMDVFVFQKLEEKTSRINDLWSKADRGNVLDEESLDPNEIKFALVTDLNVLARFEVKQIAAELSTKLMVLNSNIEDLGNYSYLKTRLEDYRNQVYAKLITWKESFKNLKLSDWNEELLIFDDVSSLGKKMESFTKAKQNRIERYIALYEQLNNITQNYTDKDLIGAASKYMSLVLDRSYDSGLENYKETTSKYAKIKRTIFDQRGYNENTDISVILAEMEKEKALTQLEIEEVRTEAFQEKILLKVAEQKQKYAIKGGELKDRVKDFADMNYLMSYLFQDVVQKDSEGNNLAACYLPTKENTVKRTQTKVEDNDKLRRLKLAKMKAKAIKIKLQLLAA
jgi:hypothetical protein